MKRSRPIARRKRVEKDWVAMYAAYQEGASCSELAGRFGLARQHVHSGFARRGWAMRGRAESIRHRAARTREERFWSMVDRRGPDECWPWRGSRWHGTGYGIFSDGGRIGAHRVALELDGRPLSDGELACHHCDNPPCVNPAHLYAGTHKSNARDMVERSRRIVRRGTEAPNSLLDECDVYEIREVMRDVPRGKRMDKYRELAEVLGVSVTTVQGAVTGVTWKWLARNEAGARTIRARIEGR